MAFITHAIAGENDKNELPGFGLGFEFMNSTINNNNFYDDNYYPNYRRDAQGFISLLNEVKILHISIQVGQSFRIEPLFGASFSGGDGRSNDGLFLIGTGLYYTKFYQDNIFMTLLGVRGGIAPEVRKNSGPEYHPFGGFVLGGEFYMFSHFGLSLETSLDYQKISEELHSFVSNGRVILKFYL